ncbi:MAG: DUF1120 domain-containing protein [Leclercia adecarboxylata]|nr:DUF1120 domain-containing protein [uncultured Leclercia sp.]MDU4842663.1 DUF1120 domain-containing protein [Leclercia adecarboxylata]
MTLFKKNATTLVMGAALLVAAQANAAEDVTLKVTGNIIPAACTPALTNSGEVAFGSIAAASIRNAATDNTLVQLGSKDITLNVKCDATTAIGFKMIDNRASSAVALSSTAFINSPVEGGTSATQSYLGFGLGLAPNDAKVGAYTVIVDGTTFTADGAPASVLGSDDEGQSWRTSIAAYQLSDSSRIITAGNTGSTEPKMFSELSVPLKITAAVQTSSVLGSDEITLDGNATLSLVYL